MSSSLMEAQLALRTLLGDLEMFLELVEELRECVVAVSLFRSWTERRWRGIRSSRRDGSWGVLTASTGEDEAG